MASAIPDIRFVKILLFCVVFQGIISTATVFFLILKMEDNAQKITEIRENQIRRIPIADENYRKIDEIHRLLVK